MTGSSITSLTIWSVIFYYFLTLSSPTQKRRPPLPQRPYSHDRVFHHFFNHLVRHLQLHLDPVISYAEATAAASATASSVTFSNIQLIISNQSVGRLAARIGAVFWH
ncbi:3059_t:CDS:2, partial [Paraglomus occultum]